MLPAALHAKVLDKDLVHSVCVLWITLSYYVKFQLKICKIHLFEAIFVLDNTE